jgi:hypothetical protein
VSTFGVASLGMRPSTLAPEAPRRPPPDSAQLAAREILAFARWAHELPAFPTTAQLLEQFDCGEVVADRWLEALAHVYQVDRDGQPLGPTP